MLLVWFGVLLAVYVLLRIDWTPGVYRVGLHEGGEPTLESRLTPARLTVGPTGITLAGNEILDIPFDKIEQLSVGPFQGARRVFRFRYGERQFVVIVVRVMLARWFFVGDHFKARKLEDTLRREAVFA